ncbi:MAG TPA: hypothetical protein VII56_16740 [Rhizomicrobium sp.]
MLLKLLRSAIIGITIALVLSTIALPLAVWGTKDAPAFYGAFAAAIVAAIAVIMGSYYQNALSTQREQRLQKRVQISEAVDLSFWLRHAAEEMKFISLVLKGVQDRDSSSQTSAPEVSLTQFREIVSANFFGELQKRASDAAKLPPEIAKQVSRVIYSTFTVADRILALRGAVDSFHPSFDQIGQYILIANRRSDELRAAAQIIESWLIVEDSTFKSLGPSPET